MTNGPTATATDSSANSIVTDDASTKSTGDSLGQSLGDKPASYRGESNLPIVSEEAGSDGPNTDRIRDDSSSLYSVSSKSTSQATRRRITRSDRQRSRTASVARSEEEMGSLGRQLGFGFSEQDRGVQHWGIDDEAKMSLE